MGKIRQSDTTSRKFFQHVSHHLMSKIGPFGNLFRKIFSNCFARVSTVIDHPHESCRHCLLSAASYSPLPFYVKIEAKWKHFLKIFWYAAFNIVFRGYCLHTGSAPFISPSISTWRKSSVLETPEKNFFRHEARAVNCPTLLHVKIWAIWHRQNQILQQMWPCWIAFWSLRIILNEGWQAQK